MPNPNDSRFVELIQQLPRFESTEELATLVSHHGNTLALLQAVVDGKILSKDDACRLWADSPRRRLRGSLRLRRHRRSHRQAPGRDREENPHPPAFISSAKSITVAIATPGDADLIKRLSQITQMTVSPVFALPRDIDDSIAIHYSTEEKLAENFAELEHSSEFDNPNLAGEKLALLADSESVIKLLDGIIYYAIRERATDIHIEPQETICRIRFRVDGMLREMFTYSRKLHRSIVCRLKIAFTQP